MRSGIGVPIYAAQPVRVFRVRHFVVADDVLTIHRDFVLEAKVVGQGC